MHNTRCKAFNICVYIVLLLLSKSMILDCSQPIYIYLYARLYVLQMNTFSPSTEMYIKIGVLSFLFCSANNGSIKVCGMIRIFGFIIISWGNHVTSNIKKLYCKCGNYVSIFNNWKFNVVWNENIGFICEDDKWK